MYRRQNFLWLESEGWVYEWVELPKNASNSRFEIEAVKRLGNFVDCLKVALGNFSHGMSHKNGFTTSSAYKLGLRSPISAKRATDIVILCVKEDFLTKKNLILNS